MKKSLRVSRIEGNSCPTIPAVVKSVCGVKLIMVGSIVSIVTVVSNEWMP